jgi:hypothetical protein
MSDTRTPRNSDTWCVHYNGIPSKTCRLGIAYETVVDRDAQRQPRAKYPCFEPYADTCASHRLPTAEELRANDAEIARMVEAFVSDLQNWICPHCKTPVQHEQQVGRCVYARPCGCRLRQGKARGKRPTNQSEEQ